MSTDSHEETNSSNDDETTIESLAAEAETILTETDCETVIGAFATAAETILTESGRLQGIDEDIYADGAIKHAFRIEWWAERHEKKPNKGQAVAAPDPDVVLERVMTRMTRIQTNDFVKDHIEANNCTDCGLGLAGTELRPRDAPSGERLNADNILLCPRCHKPIPEYR